MLPPNPLDAPPNVDAPHTWCNWTSDTGAILCTLHTRDDWAYATWITVESDGAHVYFFKRIAPGTMRGLGRFVEGLEKVEEWFARAGIDIPGWAEWIHRYKITARNDGDNVYNETEQNGLMLGGCSGPFWTNVEQFYANHPA